MGTALYHLVHALAALPGEARFVLYVDHPGAQQHAPQDDRFTVRLLPHRAYPLWEQTVLPAAASEDRLDILHCPANTAPLRLSKRVKLILTIHDVMYLLPARIVPRSPAPYQ